MDIRGKPDMGSIPSPWLDIARSWSAQDLLSLRRRVDARGIAEDDLPAVKAVWDEMQTNPMRIYQGRLDGSEAVVRYRRDDECHWHPLPLRLDVRNHSPSGFAWGYLGSGPAQLALALLCLEIGEERAMRLHQRFKAEVIARMSQDRPWTATSVGIRAWVEASE
jgi:hypothetical protein